MQVSWIEPDEVRALASLLQDVAPGASSGAWDVQGLPDALSPPAPPLLPQSTPPAVVTEAAATAPAPPAAPVRAPVLAAEPSAPASAPVPSAPPEPALMPTPLAQVAEAVRSVALEPAPVVTVDLATLNPEVILIREKLRVIRDRAKQAGLLTEEAPPPAVQAFGQAAPLEAPAAPAAPSPLSVLPSRESIHSILRPAPVEPAARPALEAPAPQPDSEPLSDAAILAAQLLDEHLLPEDDSIGFPFPPIEGTIKERLDHFAAWALQITASQELVLVDDHGDLLWGNPTHPEIVMATMLAVQGALRNSAGSVQKPPTLLQTHVGGDRTVSILPCSTRHGLTTLALINARSLTEAGQPALREALIHTIEGNQAGTGTGS